MRRYVITVWMWGFCATVLGGPFWISGDRPVGPLPAHELYLALRKLTVLGSVLYVGAHPDDENTALLAYFARGRGFRAAYLSLTRGAGGQNLLGNEKDTALAVLRTWELIAARRLDGAEQYFTRARDFGYSKSPEETLRFWGADRILSDVVWIFRRFRPDVVITRFPEDGQGGHGHHTASAILAHRAFAAAGDPTRFPDQLDVVQPWQPRRLFWNRWRRARRTSQPELMLNLHVYRPLLGQTFLEIAAAARSMHKSQGFGVAARREPWPELLVLVDGASAETDPFEGIDTTWRRIPGGAPIDALLHRALRTFDMERPWTVVPDLVAVWRILQRLESSDPWVTVKKNELRRVLGSALGLWIEAVADTWAAVPGEELAIRVRVVHYAPVEIEWVRMAVRTAPPDARELHHIAVRSGLTTQVPTDRTVTVRVPGDLPVSHPCWLYRPPAPGYYRVSDRRCIDRAVDPPPLQAVVWLRIGNDTVVPFHVPVVYRWVDPVRGELYRRVLIVPPVVLRADPEVMIFPDSNERTLAVEVRSPRPPRTGTLHLRLPEGWAVRNSESMAFTLTPDRDAVVLRVRVRPPERSAVGELHLVAAVDGRSWSHGLQVIDYPHIPVQVLFPPARVRLVRVQLHRGHERIGYVMGSGDDIPRILRQIGYSVTLLSDADLAHADLSRWDVIITGIRAFNTRPALKHYHARLMAFVRNGGTLIVQYNTTRHLLMRRIGPYPFRISRVRVTDETAPVTFLTPDHPLLHRPNRITEDDFTGWVQERGLYFADTWDPRYTTVLACADPGEPPRAGGLLYTRYGKGVFIYTAYAWFRQLPAGVPGALRLFVNLIAAGR